MIRRRTDSGQVTVVAVLAMPVILGMVGLAIDVGYLRATKRQMQTAADSAAIAGALALNDTTSDYQLLATNAAGGDGFTDGTSGIAVAVNWPPAIAAPAGPCTTQPSSCVEVIITQSYPLLFAGIMGVGPFTVAARAVAWAGANGISCIYALSPHAPIGVDITGVNFNAPKCGTLINSDSPTAALWATGDNINTPYFGMRGGYNDKGSNTGSTVFATGIPPVSDPLASLPAPPISLPCSGTADPIGGIGATVIPGSNCYSVSVSGAINVTFNPGQYSSITISGSTGVTFNPGLYTIVGPGGLNFGGANVSGTGVTFYLGPKAGAVTATGSNSSLTAPTTGTYAGILFFQNPGDTSAATIGGSNAAIVGALYFPAAQLTFDGSNAGSAYTILVANTIVFSGSNATLNSNYSSLPGGSPIKTAVLVE